MAALPKRVQDALEAHAVELEVAATWHSGPRERRLNQLAKQARQIASGDITAEEITAMGTGATTVDPANVPADATPKGDSTKKS